MFTELGADQVSAPRAQPMQSSTTPPATAWCNVKGLAPEVPIFHRFDPSWASLGLFEVAEGLSSRLGVWYPCGYELVAWYGREHTRLVLRRSLTSLRPSVRREARENGRRKESCLNRWAFEGSKAIGTCLMVLDMSLLCLFMA